MKAKKREIKLAIEFFRFGLFSLSEKGTMFYADGINLIDRFLNELEEE